MAGDGPDERRPRAGRTSPRAALVDARRREVERLAELIDGRLDRFRRAALIARLSTARARLATLVDAATVVQELERIPAAAPLTAGTRGYPGPRLAPTLPAAPPPGATEGPVAPEIPREKVVIKLRLLGAGDISGAPRDQADALCGQPKRLAVLAYLALTSPRGFQRRDRIVGLFWPELEQERARAQLRRALFEIRRALGDAVLRTRGDEEVAVDPDAIECDAVELVDAFDRRRYARVLELYRQGDLLPGYFVPDAAGFEDWLERERADIRDKASAAAWSLAAQSEQAGEQTVAARFARQAADLAPTNERQLRHVMSLLERVGDRAGAIAVYEDARRRVQRELGVPYSPETHALADRIRGGNG